MKEQYLQYVREMGKNKAGLGRWTWLRIEGNNNIKTTVIIACLSCKPRKQVTILPMLNKKNTGILSVIRDALKNFLERIYLILLNFADIKETHAGWKRKYANRKNF